MAARSGNGNGVVGMYPAQNNPIFAFNAARSKTQSLLLHVMQKTAGNHVVNFSLGYIDSKEILALKQGIWWTTQIRQRNLENRVLLVNSAGNSSDHKANRIGRAERNWGVAAAGLRDDLELVVEEKRRECGNALKRIGRILTSGDPCRTIITSKTVNSFK
jgi:hypothetical protein